MQSLVPLCFSTLYFMYFIVLLTLPLLFFWRQTEEFDQVYIRYSCAAFSSTYVKDRMTYTHKRTLTERYTKYNSTNTVCRFTRLQSVLMRAEEIQLDSADFCCARKRCDCGKSINYFPFRYEGSRPINYFPLIFIIGRVCVCVCVCVCVFVTVPTTG